MGDIKVTRFRVIPTEQGIECPIIQEYIIKGGEGNDTEERNV